MEGVDEVYGAWLQALEAPVSLAVELLGVQSSLSLLFIDFFLGFGPPQLSDKHRAREPRNLTHELSHESAHESAHGSVHEDVHGNAHEG